MDLIGKSPVSAPILIIGKLAFLGCALFFLVKVLGIAYMYYDGAFTNLMGMILYIGGLSVVLVAILHLGESLAVGIPERETQLKTQGLYRFSRNPIYTGAFIMCLGSCLYAIHPLNFLLSAVAIAVHLRIVQREEEFLEQRFGQAWLEYKKQVPRYLGRILH